jgi:hypothetical protein
VKRLADAEASLLHGAMYRWGENVAPESVSTAMSMIERGYLSARPIFDFPGFTVWQLAITPMGRLAFDCWLASRPVSVVG